LQSTVWDEAVKLQAADNDFHRRDLWEAIESGDFPEWELAVQLFTEKEADAFPFDHLDPTKLIPEELVPLQVIGRLVLDRNPDNLFAETEQVAFCPANIVPGIDFSNDPLLQGRLFSYLDTQLSRLGSPNFHQIPINAPKCPFANQQRDGHMQMQVPTGRVAYEPASLDPENPLASRAKGTVHFAEKDGGSKGRLRPESFADHYSQARMFFRSQSALEQAHIASALVFELSKVETEHVRMAVLAQLQNVDGSLARRVATGLGLDDLPAPAKPAVAARNLDLSPALRIIDRMKPTLRGRCIGVLISDGTSMAGVESLRDAARKAGAQVKLVAPKLTIRDAAGKVVKVDKRLVGTPSVVFDAVASMLSLEEGGRLAKEAAAVDWFRDAFGHLKAIAACKGTRLILAAGGITPDAGVVMPEETATFLKLATSRIWTREPQVRTLA
jgi:catalase